MSQIDNQVQQVMLGMISAVEAQLMQLKNMLRALGAPAQHGFQQQNFTNPSEDAAIAAAIGLDYRQTPPQQYVPGMQVHPSQMQGHFPQGQQPYPPAPQFQNPGAVFPQQYQQQYPQAAPEPGATFDPYPHSLGAPENESPVFASGKFSQPVRHPETGLTAAESAQMGR